VASEGQAALAVYTFHNGTSSSCIIMFLNLHIACPPFHHLHKGIPLRHAILGMNLHTQGTHVMKLDGSHLVKNIIGIIKIQDSIENYLHVLQRGHVHHPCFSLFKVNLVVLCVRIDDALNTRLIVHVGDVLPAHPVSHMLARISYIRIAGKECLQGCIKRECHFYS
jgi:hypothetical protein